MVIEAILSSIVALPFSNTFLPAEVCQIERIFGLTFRAFRANVTDAVGVDFGKPPQVKNRIL